MTDDENLSADDLSSEVTLVTVTEYANARVETPYFVGDMYDRPPQAFGVSVHNDGPYIALGAGTLNEEDDDQLYVYQSLTPAQAREIGHALVESAEQADERLNESPDDAVTSGEETESFIRRLLP